jgi:hypothetical protein
MDDAEHARRVQDRVNQGSVEVLRGERWDEVRRLPADELAVRHDACLILATNANVLGTDVQTMFMEQARVYEAERARREEVRQGVRMEALTRSLNRLTWFIAGATVVGVVLTAIALISGA